MNHRSKGQLMCRLEGCPHEVLFKTVDSGGGSGGGYVDPLERRASIIRDRNGHTLQGRGSPAGAGAAGGGGDDETCTQLKPSHDAVCAYHARCPVPECSQARLQYLDPAYESRHGDSLPVYQRWEYCADRYLPPKTSALFEGVLVENHRPRLAIARNKSADKRVSMKMDVVPMDVRNWFLRNRFAVKSLSQPTDKHYLKDIKCDISNCNRARHNVADTKEYLRFCVDHATCAVNRCKDMKIEQSLYCANHTCRERGCSKSSQSKPFCSEHCCAEVNCRYPKPWAASPNPRGKFCPLHTCRAQDCPEFVDRLAIFCRTHGCSKPKCHEKVIVEGFCLDHLKAHYITQGELKARGGSSSSPKDSPTSTTGQPTTMTTRPNPAQPPTFPRRLSQQSLTSIRPGPGQRANSILLHNGHAHEILIPPDEHPDELLDHSRDDPLRFQLNQVVARQHARQAYQAHVDDPDPDLDNDDNEDNDDDDDDDLNDHHLPPNLNPSSLNSHLSHVSHHTNQSHRSYRSLHNDIHNKEPGGGSGSGRSSLSSEAVSALSDNENIGAARIVNGSLVNGNGNGGAESPGDPPEYSKVAAPGSIVSVGQGQGQAQGQGQGQGHGEGGETKTGGGSRREERERERNRRKVLERDGGTGTGGGVGMPGSFVGGGDGKGEDSDGW
ncbi:uncharacterized protein B0T23DRAFT_396528 [Neurospora hispaniola]|uniref:Uncharacterized protein n=1 Tax=Neurospora hispaniola TaxID=588809 RepID=A0AAJ0MQ04_9PEZI|nr:hypothetical protein B0T23DRAFT_396528 [Neurospora hispaniola]